jgi:hypothetical protein
MSDFRSLTTTQNAIDTQQNDSLSVDSARANKEVEAAVVLAHRFPRSEKAAFDRIMNACSRPTFAGKAIYSFKRGAEKVEGPSIRLAETIAKAWGNLQFGVREKERRGNASVVEAFCWDLETNVRSVKEFEIRHIRDTKQGVKHLTNERDIYEMVANQGARRLRNCILSCIPEDVVEEACIEVNKTLLAVAKGASVDMPTRIRSMVESFAEIGVTKEQIELKINSKVEAISAKQMVDLGKIYNSLKDNMSEIGDWFKMPDLVPELHKIAETEVVKASLTEFDELYTQALELGVSTDILERILKSVNETKPETVKKAVDFLKSTVADLTRGKNA